MAAGKIPNEINRIDQPGLNFPSINCIICEGDQMKNVYTAVLKQDGKWWIGWIEEVPGVNCQEGTREELLESLRVTLSEALELNKKDAIAAAGGSYQEELIPV